MLWVSHSPGHSWVNWACRNHLFNVSSEMRIWPPVVLTLRSFFSLPCLVLATFGTQVEFMTANRVLTLNERRATLLEFGHIVHVGQDEGWIFIRNEEGVELFMKKLYHRWPNVLFKCEKYKALEMSVVTRCAIDSPYLSYFNEIYVDPPNAPLLKFPKDGDNAPQTVEQLVSERIWNMEQWAKSLDEKGNIEAERNRYKEALDCQDKSDSDLTDSTKTFLMQHYDEFSVDRTIWLSIEDRAKSRAALRLGVDLSGVSKVRVHLESYLWNTNFIHVTLIDYEGIDAVVGLHRKKDGKNWIATVNNGDSDWWKHEKQLLSNKDMIASISHWLHLFKQVQASRYKLGRINHDVEVKPETGINIIPFPKGLGTNRSVDNDQK